MNYLECILYCHLISTKPEPISEPIPNELDILIDKTELFPDLSEIVR